MKKSTTSSTSEMKRWAIGVLLMTFLSHAYAQTDTIQTNVPALKNAYARDFNIGCLLSYRNIGFPTDPHVTGQSAVITPNGGYLVKFHMNSMSPGNNMKPQYTVDIASSAAAYAAASSAADQDSVDTHPIVKFNGDLIAQLNWAQRQGFTFRGHTLVWHSQTPATFFTSGYVSSGARLTKEKMARRLDNYIHEVIRLIHEGWPGLLSAMDVVNEAIDDNTGAVRTSGNEWYSTFGDSTYVMTAFQLARQYTTQYGETQMKLYYNDYNTSSAKKADGIVRLLTPIFEAGYLDGIGMQEHDAISSPTAAAWISSYEKFFPICTEMAVTELDVTTGSAAPSSAVLTQQANQYGQLFKCFVERSYRSGRGKIISVSKDGLNDQYTFKTNQASSLWDAGNQCKPAFYAAASVGLNYDMLDSLIAYSDTLQENEYTAASWSGFSAALSAAKGAMTMNYSASVSAADRIGAAKDSLAAAIDGLVGIGTAIVNGTDIGPKTFKLNQNYPNPFNPTTKISYELSTNGLVSLKVYDALGREVTTLVEARQNAGYHEVTFNASELPTGIYLYRLITERFSSVRKLLLLK
jgi:endo-1,4-beta-xylanase